MLIGWCFGLISKVPKLTERFRLKSAASIVIYQVINLILSSPRIEIRKLQIPLVIKSFHLLTKLFAIKCSFDKIISEALKLYT